MKIIYNKFIPFGGYDAMNICGFLFVNEKNVTHYDDEDFQRMVRHESIHSAQIFEMLIIFFYIWYCIEWFIKLFKYGDSDEDGRGDAYHNISFEREAYDNQDNLDYLKNRKRFSWWYYLTHKTHGQN